MLKKYQFLIFQTLAHLTTIWAMYYYSWQDWLLVIPFYILFVGFGISITFHRYCTHQAFILPTPIKFLGLLFGSLNGHGPSVGWSYKHALHHELSDSSADPHSPVHHYHWDLYWKNLIFDVNSTAFTSSIDVSKKIIPWDTMIGFFEKYYWYIHLAYAGMMLSLGTKWLVFGYLVPGCLSWVAFGYGVVIAAHYWGYVSYNNKDNSKNNSWVSWLVFGEGYQNNHHAYPRDGDYTKTSKEVDPLGKLFKHYFGRQ
jgi:stearoyl-CoA desaturase (delta-9 desaturase)